MISHPNPLESGGVGGGSRGGGGGATPWMETSSGAWKEKKEGMKKKGPGGALYAK
jgi:hypothetical protein